MSKVNKWFFRVYYILVLMLSIVGFLVKFSFEIIYFSLIATFVGAILQIFENQIIDILNKNITEIPHIELLYEEEFYNKWEFLIKQAVHNVDISHMNLLPPQNREGTSQEKYFNSLSKIVKASPATFRRVERISKQKISWIEELIENFDGVNNFSLYCINDPKKSEMADLLSIQRVDKDHLFIVALNEHKTTTNPRDIYIRDDNVCDYFVQYYNKRLIQQSINIINSGEVNYSKWSELKKELAV